jgi:hypothetical protein
VQARKHVGRIEGWLLGHRVERSELAAVEDEMIRNVVLLPLIETYARNSERTFRALAPFGPAHQRYKRSPRPRWRFFDFACTWLSGMMFFPKQAMMDVTKPQPSYVNLVLRLVIQAWKTLRICEYCSDLFCQTCYSQNAVQIGFCEMLAGVYFQSVIPEAQDVTVREVK